MFASTYAQDKAEPSIKSILLKQLKSTHTGKDWFVSATVALDGVTADQAKWTDGSGNHSIGQLTNHLVFWNERLLRAFKELPEQKFSGDNEETFNNFDAAQWSSLLKKLDSVMAEWEKVIEESDEAKLKGWYETIANMSTHNSYHVGQIVFNRKLQGSWDPAKGVK